MVLSSGRTRTAALALALSGTAALTVLGAGAAGAAGTPVPLGTARTFAVLGASTITNTGPTVLTGDLGLWSGTAVTGAPLVSGTSHVTDSVAHTAQDDAGNAAISAAGLAASSPNLSSPELAGKNLVAGVYDGGALTLNGVLTLTGNSSSVFVFRAASTLVTGPGSSVALVGPINSCNVFWLVGSSATLDTTTNFVGTIDAQDSITANTGAQVSGRLLARTGAVTLDSNRVSVPVCGSVSSGTTGGTTSTPTVAPTTSPAPTPTASATPAPAASASPAVKPSSPTPTTKPRTPSVAVTPAAPTTNGAGSRGTAAAPRVPTSRAPGVTLVRPRPAPQLPSVPSGSLPMTGARTSETLSLGLLSLAVGLGLVVLGRGPRRSRHSR